MAGFPSPLQGSCLDDLVTQGYACGSTLGYRAPPLRGRDPVPRSPTGSQAEMIQMSETLIGPMGIELMSAGDWPQVCEIYEQGIATGAATFETTVPSWESWDQAHLSACRLVARRDGVMAGWAALSPFSKRDVYRGVAEASIYVSRDLRGAGVGSALMQETIQHSEAAGIWTLLAKVFPENRASLAMATKFGFRTVGVLERIGQHSGVWRDVILLQRRAALPR
jgi:phosphinothricin acetyltransferase